MGNVNFRTRVLGTSREYTLPQNIQRSRLCWLGELEQDKLIYRTTPYFLFLSPIERGHVKVSR